MSDQSHILVVDDDPSTRLLLSEYFGGEGYRVTEAGSGGDMREALAQGGVDLVLLDITMPGEDGLQLAREVISTTDTPVIFVSGKDEEIDRIVGLELGAVDYVVKPFNLRELLARVRIAIRQAAAAPRDEREVLAFEGWTLDLAKRTLTAPSGDPLQMTKAEFDLLAAFARSPGKVMSRDDLLASVSHREWSYGDRTVDVLVRRLRQLLEEDPKEPRLLTTVYGVGYVFTPDVV